MKVCHGGCTALIHRPLQQIVPLEVQKDIDDIDAAFIEPEDNAAIEMHEDRNENAAVEIVKDSNVVIHNGDGRKLVDKSEQLRRCRVATNPDELPLKRKQIPDRFEINW